IRPGLGNGVGNGVEDGPAFVRRAALARRDAAHDVGVVGRGLLRMKRALASGQTLHDQTGLFRDQNSHAMSLGIARLSGDRVSRRRRVRYRVATLCASFTTVSAASPMESALVRFKPLSRSICLPSSTLVPSMRITIGTGTPNSFTAAMTPAASTSHRRMPPK